MKFINVFVILQIAICSITNNVYAKSIALLTNFETKAYKLDLETNRIVANIEFKQDIHMSNILLNTKDGIIIDKKNNQIFVIYDRFGINNTQGVKVIGLNNFEIKKDLGIISVEPDGTLPKVIVPPIGNRFYVVWLDKTKANQTNKGLTTSIYDKISLSKLQDISNFPLDISLPISYSVDGSKLYSVNISTNTIKTYESTSLNIINTVDITQIWSSPLYDKHDEYYFDDKILLSENIKSKDSDANQINYFIYDIGTNKASVKTKVKDVGNEIVSNDSSKLIINEIQNEYIEQSLVGTIPLNKIHIYDLKQSKKVATLDLNHKYRKVTLSDISPDNTKLFLVAENIVSNASVLIVVDIASKFSVIAEIIVEASLLTFTEE